MYKITILFFLQLLFILPSTNIQSTPDYGWDLKKEKSTLYVDGKKVYATGDPIRELPNISTESLINYSFLVSEYYLNRNDNDGMANLIYLLRANKPDLKFLDAILSALWALDKNDSGSAQKKLEDYRVQEKDPYLISLAFELEKVLTGSTKKSGSEYDFIDQSCSNQKPYYVICRTLKLKNYISKLMNVDASQNYRKYLNLDRNIAYFFEESSLSYIYFLDRFLPQVSPKLAYSGMAYEAVAFQKMLLTSEQLTSFFNPLSYERLSFYQMLADDLVAAEETLKLAIQHLDPQSSLRNNYYLKLGAIAYLRKDYKQSLNYYISINLKAWGKSIRHPYFDEPLTVNGARDLISVSIWKAKSPAKAIEALKTIKLHNNSFTEEELFIRLRIAHVIMNDRPHIAEKMTEEILYLAQSKGWKRVEYAATIMNGYCNIISKKYRKAVIQFTKSRGILGSTDPTFTSDWMREVGLFHARYQAKEKMSNMKKIIQSLVESIKNQEHHDDLLTLRNYLDQRFNSESFLRQIISYNIKNKNYVDVLDILFNYYLSNFSNTVVNDRSIFQVYDVNKRIRLYRGFRPSQDNKIYKSKFSESRKLLASKLKKEIHSFNSSFVKKIHDPFLASLTFDSKIYIILYNPKSSSNPWQITVHKSSDYRSNDYYSSILSMLETLRENESIQIYLNPIGVDIYQRLKKYSKLNLRLFYSFSHSNKNSYSEMSPTAVRCDEKNKFASNIDVVDPEHFEGTKIFSKTNRLHIWNFKDIFKPESTSTLEDYNWKCGNNSISFLKLQRRMDSRMTPNGIIATESLFQKSSLASVSLDYYLWSDFWMKKGVQVIYYIDNIDSQSPIINNLIKDQLSKPIQNYEDIIRVQNAMKNASVNHILLLKELY